MTALSTLGLTELDIVQNPAIGAYLTWQFTLGYQEDGSEAVPIPLAFLVLPIILHRQTFDELASTRKASGLPLFAAKFDKEREILMTIHGRAMQLRALSLQSIGVAATSKLVRVDHGHRPPQGISARAPRRRQTETARKIERLCCSSG